MDESVTPSQRTVATLYAALLDRAPDASGMRFWASAASSGASWESIVAGFLTAPAGRDAYPAGLSATAFVSVLYQTLFDRAPDAGGAAFWASALESRDASSAEGRAWLVLQLVNAASQPLATRPEGMSDSAYAQTLADRAVLANKTEAGVYFATVLGSDDIALATRMMAQVTANPASVQAAIDTATGVPPTQPELPPPPGAPVITSAALTKLAEPVLSGTVAVGATVKVDVGGATYTVASADGTWRVDLATAAPTQGTLVLNANGDNPVSAVAIGAGGTSAAATQTLTIDTTPPSAPVITSAAATHIAAPVIAGTATTGDVLTVTVGGATYTLTVANGTWQVDLATATPTAGTLALNTSGANPVSVIATDLAGNVSDAGTQVLDIAPNHAPQPRITSADSVAVIQQKFADYPGTIAAVTADGLSAEQWSAVAAAIGKVGSGNITGAMVLTADVAAGDALALLSKYTGTNATLDASVHPLATLQMLAGNTRVVALTNLSLNLGDAAVTDDVTSALLARASGARVDLTGASTAELRTVGNTPEKLADGGITGTVVIDRNLNLNQQLNLLGSKLAASAQIAANVTNLDAPALKALAARPDQIVAGGLAGGMHLNAQLSASEIGVLVGKFNGTMITAYAAGMNADAVAQMAAGWTKFATGGISGTLAMSGSLPFDQAAGLLSKYGDAQATITGAATYSIAQLDQLASLGGVTRLDTATLTITGVDGGTSAQVGRILGKSQGATIDNQSGDSTFLPALLGNLGAIATQGIVNWGATDRIALNHDTLLSASFGTFLGKLGAGIKFAVDAAQMTADQVVILFQQAGKIAALSNLSVPAGVFDKLPNDIGTLFTLQIGIRADLAGTTDAQLAGVATYVNHLAADGLTGSFTLRDNLSPAQLADLLGKTAVAANVTVDVTRMSQTQIDRVLGHLDKTDTIIGLSIAADAPLLGDAPALATLLNHTSGASIDLQGASQAVIDVVLGKLTHFADGGLGHAMLTLSAAQWQGLDVATLSAKLNRDAVVKVQGTAASDTLDFTQMTKSFTVDGGVGADRILLGSGPSTVVLGGRSTNTAADFDPLTTPPLGIDSIRGVSNGVKLQLSQDIGAYIDGVALQPTARLEPMWTSISYRSDLTFADLYSAASTMGSGAVPSTATQVFLRGIQYIGPDGVMQSYLFINDGVAGIDEHDFVVHLVGGGQMLPSM